MSTDLELADHWVQLLAESLNSGAEQIRSLAAFVERSESAQEDVRRAGEAERLVHRALLDLEVASVRLAAAVGPVRRSGRGLPDQA